MVILWRVQGKDDVSDESGRREVYVRAFPDPGGAKRLISRGGGSRPIWSDDGSELFYIGPNDDVFADDVQLGETFQFGPPSLLFSRSAITYAPLDADFDVDPRAERFYVYSAEGGGSASRLVIVENFFRELREKVGG